MSASSVGGTTMTRVTRLWGCVSVWTPKAILAQGPMKRQLFISIMIRGNGSDALSLRSLKYPH